MMEKKSLKLSNEHLARAIGLLAEGLSEEDRKILNLLGEGVTEEEIIAKYRFTGIQIKNVLNQLQIPGQPEITQETLMQLHALEQRKSKRMSKKS